MKENSVRNRVLWNIVVIVAFTFCYYLCIYTFFELHYMKSWTNTLAGLGIVTLVVSAIMDKRKVSMMTVVGYIGGFALAMLFNKDGVDYGGARTNNAWQIWTVVFVVAILVGVAWEIINKRVIDK